MKILYVVRHAKAEWSAPGQNDFDRLLSSRGNAEAAEMARLMKGRHTVVDYILSSPAARTLATCKIMASALGVTEKNIRTDRRLYNADEEMILKILQNAGDHNAVMLVGHNPGLTSFANSITSMMIDHIPTCGIVTCDVSADSWEDLHWGGARQISLDVPAGSS